MAREDLLGVFVSLALRPHTRCPYRLPRPLPRQIRLASTSTPPPGDKAALLKQGAEIKAASRIPLHVGVDRNPENRSAISKIPIPRGVTGEKFIPSALARPLGLTQPPIPGQNSPVDKRTLKERHDEFTSYEKALERRRVYLRTFFRPYYQEWKRMDHFKGKSFQSSPRLFKREKALYFPNIWGQTLAKEGDGPDGGRDTTPVLTGKVSIVSMQASRWAEEQVDSFISEKDNPQLNKLFQENPNLLQRVDVNIQSDWMKVMIVKFFSSRLRKLVPEERWDRYFMIKLPRDIRRGLTDEIRDAMGFLNSQVGYVYLVDSSCKIRWAGSGHAWEGEVEGLNAAVQRLLSEEETMGQTSSTPLPSSTKTTKRQRAAPKVSSDQSHAIPETIPA